MSDLFIVELALNNDFSPLVGKTIAKAETLSDAKGYIDVLTLTFTDGTFTRMDTMKKGNGAAALFALLYRE